MGRILISGSTAFDLLLGYDGAFTDAIRPDTLDALSVSFRMPHFARHHGGTAANIAWTLKLLGGDPLMVSTVGKDGGAYVALLRERGIDTAFLEERDDAMTATAIIGTDTDERQIIFFHPGADGCSTWPKASLTDARDDVGIAIIAPRDTRVSVNGMQWCKEYGVPYLFDPGQAIPAYSDDDLRRAIEGSRGIIVNEYEWSMLQQRLSLTEENALLKTPLLIVTRGEAGVTAFTEDGAETVSACNPEAVVNPTGAGDAFRAGLLYGMDADWSLLHALRLGCACGSLAVEAEGTLVDSLDREAFLLRAEETYGERLPEL